MRMEVFRQPKTGDMAVIYRNPDSGWYVMAITKLGGKRIERHYRTHKGAKVGMARIGGAVWIRGLVTEYD